MRNILLQNGIRMNLRHSPFLLTHSMNEWMSEFIILAWHFGMEKRIWIYKKNINWNEFNNIFEEQWGSIFILQSSVTTNNANYN